MQKRSTAINVVARAAQVLKACQRLGPGLSLGDIARHVGLPRSTVQRIVQTLVAEGLLATSGEAKSIMLGPDLLAMGVGQAADVVERAQPYLRELASRTGETVDLSRLNRDHMVFLNQVAGRHRLQAVSAVGDIFPLHCTANGKAALALLSPEERDRLLPAKLKSFTPHTISKKSDLLHKLNPREVSIDQQEHTMGVCAIGLAFTDRARQIYAVSVPIPSVRFAEQLKPCTAALREAVMVLSERL